MTRLAVSLAGGENVRAFLDTIAWSEGTSRISGSDDGYNVIIGGALFDSYADHPRKTVPLARLNIKSSAAGRYQILARYWDIYYKQLNLSGGFTPENQDRVAIQQLRETRAFPLLQQGKFEAAIARCCNIWASLPGAGYGQHESSVADLYAAYQRGGGALA